MMRGRRGFTLIELLVAVGVIAILIGLLLPALSGARRVSGQLTCASNLHQWATAVQLYAAANNGYLPRRGQGVGVTTKIDRPTDWFNALPPMFQAAPYIDLSAAKQISRPGGKTSVWLCPQASDMTGDNYWAYAMNMGLSVWDSDQNDGQPDKITSVGSTSILVLFADAPGNYCSVFPSATPGGYNPVARHNNSVNIVFLDGHVAAIPGDYIGIGTGLKEQPDVRWHPPQSTWDNAR
jgi:prepilin-type N-terminal cleavage/methylation domain-containing protein/prepilin-type processing-associated H-X9-DG protein